MDFKKIKNIEEFEQRVETGSVAILFTHSWCRPSVELKEIIKKQRQDSKKLFADIIEVDIDELPTIANRFNVRFSPRVMLFESGKLIANTHNTYNTYIDIIDILCK